MPIFSKLTAPSRIFYTFSGFHSFLIGLFPFFIPVFLWKNNFSLSHIAWFIATTALSFCCTLRLWESAFAKLSLRKIIFISFVLEILLVSVFFLHEWSLFLFCSAIINGAYSCLFWITQRILFLATITRKNSGRKFGNFQIFVFILLKAGILMGGLLLDNLQLVALYLITITINIIAMYYFVNIERQTTQVLFFAKSYRPLTSKNIFSWCDEHHSRSIFALDGIFLYLESYFWGLSLFLLVKENFRTMAMLVILLAMSFGFIFYFIKNNIDKMHPQRIYILAVITYSLSWLLRGAITQIHGGPVMGITLIIITFCTAFFRLAFNNRFFEHAQQGNAQQYILLKSYYSQFFIALFFAVLGKFYESGANIEILLQKTYWPAALLTLLYLSYSQKTI